MHLILLEMIKNIVLSLSIPKLRTFLVTIKELRSFLNYTKLLQKSLCKLRNKYEYSNIPVRYREQHTDLTYRKVSLLKTM